MPSAANARIHALIADHEPATRARIRELLATHPDVVVVGEASCAATAVDEIRTHAPDLVFITADTPTLSGFDVLAQLGRHRPPAIVFISCVERHAIRAFEVCALDYLLAPISDTRFSESMSRARHHIACEPAHRGTTHLARIPIKSGGRTTWIDAPSIDWIEAADYYAQLHVGGDTHLLRCSMTKLEGQLDPSRFVRIHRSAIVNIDRIRELRSDRDCRDLFVVLKDDTRIKVSRSHRRRLHALH